VKKLRKKQTVGEIYLRLPETLKTLLAAAKILSSTEVIVAAQRFAETTTMTETQNENKHLNDLQTSR